MQLDDEKRNESKQKWELQWGAAVYEWLCERYKKPVYTLSYLLVWTDTSVSLCAGNQQDLHAGLVYFAQSDF